MTKVSAIMPIGGDWNDLLLRSASSEKAAEQFNKNLERYRLQALLALAETAQAYAKIYVVGNKGFAPGLFPFQGQYFWSWIKAATEHKEAETIIERASNFTISVEHYQRSDADEE